MTAHYNKRILSLGAAFLLTLLCAAAAEKTSKPGATASRPADSAGVPGSLAVVIAPTGARADTFATSCGMPVADLCALNPPFTPKSVFGEGQALRVAKNEKTAARAANLLPELVRGPRGRKEIALTLDCGYPTEKDLARMLALLDKHEVKVTFFLTGAFLKKLPDAPVRIIAHGHQIANHTMTHPHCPKISAEVFQKELDGVEKMTAGAAATATAPKDGAKEGLYPCSTKPFWRPPFGERSRDNLRLASQAGYRSIYWTIDALDWVTSPTLATADSVYARVCEKPFAKAAPGADPLDGAIILMHLASAATPGALERMIPYLRGKGYTFVTLGRMMEP